jgi:Tfp pilus assembly protein PilZ
MHTDKRKDDRIIKRLEVKFQTNGERTSITSNLSEKGLFIRTKKVLEPGSTVNLKLDLPNNSSIYLTGKVIRSVRSVTGLLGQAKSGMGISLTNPPDNYITYISSLRH